MTHLIPFVFVFLHLLFVLHYRWIYSLVHSAGVTCYSLLRLMCRRLLVHDFNIGRAWCCAALGTDILQITHRIPFVFGFLYRLLVCFIDGSIPWFAGSKYLLPPSLVDVSSSSGSWVEDWESVTLYRNWHRHTTDTCYSPHSFRIRILAPSLWFALPMDHDFNIGRAWCCTAPRQSKFYE